ncbi:MAG: DMT family transporter [Halorientalis sp.]
MTRSRNAALFVLLAGLWGTAFVAIKAGLAYLPPVLFAAVRYDVAGLLMLGSAAWATDRWRPRTRPEWLLVGVAGTLLIAAYHAFLFVGEQGTTSAAAAVVVSLSPVLTTGFARVFLPTERLTVPGLVGLALGLVGVAVLAAPDPATLLAGDVVAEGLVFLAVLSFSLGSVLTRRLETDLPLPTMEAWAMLVGAVQMHAVSTALPGEALAAVTLSVEAVVAVAYLSVGASAVGFLVYFDLLDRLGPVEINLVSYVAPVFAAAVGFLWLGEVVDAATVGGFVLIVAGFALLKREALAATVPRLRAALGRDR